ncbi:hypothetical protein [Prosthecobacter vanneervenii]|uniref:Uncharacterized protein n=1 Tax=Prosthecobacter vanneervenii TaxID=48466 RepID=A0A7W7YBH4_9BACT|nr:hypothetical protein [Prosthecobacter vanneervenii]MBB5033142.1 hypothetical protein [Prosthecobacter vanneervenii]
MNINDLLTFAPHGRDRETLPCFPISIVGKPIECSDQSGTMRLLPGDRVRLEEIRNDHALVSHVSLKGGVLLTSLSQLQPIAVARDTTHDDDAL